MAALGLLMLTACGVITEQAAGDIPYLSGYAGTRGFREYRGQRWLVVVRQPLAEAFTPALELRTRIIRVGLGLVVARETQRQQLPAHVGQRSARAAQSEQRRAQFGHTAGGHGLGHAVHRFGQQDQAPSITRISM